MKSIIIKQNNDISEIDEKLYRKACILFREIYFSTEENLRNIFRVLVNLLNDNLDI